jgi:hypothetical protein
MSSGLQTMTSTSGFRAAGINRRRLQAETIPFRQRAVDPQLHAAGGQQVNVRCRLAGRDVAADPERPYPDARLNLQNRIFDTPVQQLQFPFESTVTRLGTGRRSRPFKTEQIAG